MSASENKTCGGCARYKVPDAGCNNYAYFNEYVDGRPLMDAKAVACSDFYPKSKAKSEKEQKTKKQLKDSGFTIDGCFEAIYHNGKPYFLMKNSEDFSVVESVELNGERFFPKEAKNMPYEPYGIFEGLISTREELFWKVRNEFQTFVDVESIWKDVLAACVLLTYHQEKSQTVPYIFLYGDNESGKSTVLQVLKFLSYRPMYGVTIPSADLYGYLEDSDSIGVILEDEVQGVNKDIDKIKIYKAGYKQGAVVPRTIITQNDRIIKYYQTFSFKACASEQIPQVKGFNERFLFVSMVEGFPEKEWTDITKEDLERLRKLRNMLLKWRMLTRKWELPNVEVSMKGRVKELWKPILQITHDLTVYDTLANFIEDQQKERLSAKQNSLEGHIVKVVTDLHNNKKDSTPYIPFQTIWLTLAEDLEGKIDDKKPHVMETSEFFQVTKHKIGFRLKEVLSGKSKPVREKDVVIKAYEFNQEKLRRVAKKYGYELVTDVTAVTDFQKAQALSTMENKEKSDVDNVENKAHTQGEVGYTSYTVTNEAKHFLKIEDLKSVFWSDQFYDNHPCGVCGYTKLTSWKGETFKGLEVWLCEECKSSWEKLNVT